MTNNMNIFISSTFEDMDYTRQKIVSNVLNKFQLECMPHNIKLNYIDLRWGVSKEDETEKRVLSRCLEDIESCSKSPMFFLGIIGRRYGWSPSREDVGDIKNDHNTLINEMLDNQYSVTELECRFAENIKGKSDTVYFIDQSDDEKSNGKLTNFKKYLTENGSVVHPYNDPEDINEILLKELRALASKHYGVSFGDIGPENITIVETFIDFQLFDTDEPSANNILPEEVADLKSYCLANLASLNPVDILDILLMVMTIKSGVSLKLVVEEINSSRLSAWVKPCLKLLCDKNGFSQRLMKDLFALLAAAAPDGLALSELIKILGVAGHTPSDIESAVEIIHPLLKDYRGKFKAIHPRLETIESFGMTEGLNSVVDELINYYRNSEGYSDDQHMLYSFKFKTHINFFWRLGGGTHGPAVMGEYWSIIDSLPRFKGHYERRKYLVYEVLLYSCAIDFERYKSFCDSLSASNVSDDLKPFLLALVNDDRIQKDFPLIISSILSNEKMNFSSTDSEQILLKYKCYRYLVGDILEFINRYFVPKIQLIGATIEKDESIEQGLKNHVVDPGSLLSRVFALYKQTIIDQSVSYEFKLYCRLNNRRGLYE